MKALFNILLFLLFSLRLYSQNTVPATNSTSTKNSSESIKIEAQDSTAVDELENEDIKDSKKPYKHKSTKKEVAVEDLMQDTNVSKSNSFYQTKSLISTQSSQRSPSPAQQVEMDQTVVFYEEHAPNSFEYHYFKYVSGNYNLDLVDHLLAAQKLKPNNSDVYVQLSAYHFIKGEYSKLKEDLQFLHKNNRLEKEVLVYAKDLLNSVNENGILLTHGFDDTYSALYLQQVEHIRSDVTIISADFLQSTQYVTVLKAKGFAFPTVQFVDTKFISSFCALNESKNMQLSMTFPRPYLSELSPKLKIVGLTFVYSSNNTNLFEQNKVFYDKKLQRKEIVGFTTDKAKKLSANYLPLILSLEEGYRQDNNQEKVDELEKLALKIKTQANVTKKLGSY